MQSGFDNLPAGEYPFTVLESGLAASKSAKNPGRQFIKVKLNVHGPKFDRHVYDQFADWFSEWKLKHFCETTGLRDEYAMGCVSPEGNAWAGREGYCRIKVRPAEGEHDERNEVVDYLPEEDQRIETGKDSRIDPRTASKKLSELKSELNQADEGDDVPF